MFPVAQSVLHRTNAILPLSSGGVRAIAVPNASLLADHEEEPYIWDYIWDLPDDRPPEFRFNAFYYKIGGSTNPADLAMFSGGSIQQVGAVYELNVRSGSDAEHVGIILPAQYLQTDQRAAQLRQYYPKTRRFKLAQPAAEVESVLRRSGISTYKELLLELLERGGKVIWGGSRPDGSMTLEAGRILWLLHTDDWDQAKSTRDVLAVESERLVVRRYMSRLRHDSPGQIATSTTVPPAAAPSRPEQAAGTGTASESGVEEAIRRIRAKPHASMPAATRSAASGPVGKGMTIENRTAHTLHVYFKGPLSRSVVVPSGQSAGVELAVGRYQVAAEVPGSSIMPFYGEQTYEAGTHYWLKFVLQQRSK